MLNNLRYEFKPGMLLNSTISGLLVGLIALVNAVTYGVTIFSDTGSPAVGIQMALISGLILSIIFGLFGSLSGMVALPQAAVVPVLAALVASIVDTMAGESQEKITATVLAAIALAALTMGVACLILGFRRLGVIIRYMPYPVSGGFLAGLGWLLLKNGYAVSMTGAFPGRTLFCAEECAMYWGPALVVGFVLFIIQQKKTWSWMTSLIVMLSVAAFYLIELVAYHIPMDELRQAGWLLQLSNSSSRDIFQFPLLKSYTEIQWSVILAESFTAMVVLFTALIGLLMNINGIETSVKEDIDPNREMQLSGFANIVSMSVGGGIVGYPAAALTAMAYQRGRPGRLTNLIISGLFALALYYGLEYVSYLPRFVLGGLLISMGINFLYEWLIQGLFKFSFGDYLVILAMFITVAYQDLLYGVVMGILLTGLIFMIRYSKTNVIRTTLTGGTFQSNVDRPIKHINFLKEHGKELLILRLQGYIFFGTAYSIYRHVKTHLEANIETQIKFLVLDFTQTTGVDSSAAMVFSKIALMADQHNFELVFCSLSELVQGKLGRSGFLLGGARFHTYENLDRATEWCESRVLYGSSMTIATSSALMSNIGEFFGQAEFSKLLSNMQQLKVDKDYQLFKQGDETQMLYLIERGQVTIYRELSDGKRMRLRQMGAGTVIGELGFYLGGKASATVTTDFKSEIYLLTISDLGKLEREDPELAYKFHRYIIQLLGQRLQNMNASVQALLE